MENKLTRTSRERILQMH